MIKLRKYLWAR